MNSSAPDASRPAAGPSPSEATWLHRLRWRFTALFTVINAVGLLAFAFFVINEDGQQGAARIDTELRLVTAAISRQVYFDAAVDFSLVNSDELTDRCPQFAILPGGARAFQAYVSRRECVPMDTGVLSGLASRAVGGRQALTGYQQARDGELVRVRAEPLLSRSGEYIGAVVAVADTHQEDVRHTGFALFVFCGCALLIGVMAIAVHLLPRRSLRSAVRAAQPASDVPDAPGHDSGSSAEPAQEVPSGHPE